MVCLLDGRTKTKGNRYIQFRLFTSVLSWGVVADVNVLFGGETAISPYRLSPMRGVVSHWVINGTKRVSTQAVFFVAPLALG